MQIYLCGNYKSYSSLKLCLEIYTDHTTPSQSHIRKNYVEICYKATMQDIRAKVDNREVWISVDETNNVKGRYIANVVIGTMEYESLPNAYSLTFQFSLV